MDETSKTQGALKTYRIHKTPVQNYRYLVIAGGMPPLAQLPIIPAWSSWYSGVGYLVLTSTLELLMAH